jgi:hypothetical protein
VRRPDTEDAGAVGPSSHRAGVLLRVRHGHEGRGYSGSCERPYSGIRRPDSASAQTLAQLW